MNTVALFDIMYSTIDHRVFLLRYFVDSIFGAWMAVGRPEDVGKLDDDSTFLRIIAALQNSDSPRRAKTPYKLSKEEQAAQLHNHRLIQVALTDENRVKLQRMCRKSGGWISSSKIQDRAIHRIPIELTGFAADARWLLADAESSRPRKGNGGHRLTKHGNGSKQPHRRTPRPSMPIVPPRSRI